MAKQDLRRDNGLDPTDEQLREYQRTYDAVTAAARSGYHKPYCNLHSDGDLWFAYDLGFRDAVSCQGIAA